MGEVLLAYFNKMGFNTQSPMSLIGSPYTGD